MHLSLPLNPRPAAERRVAPSPTWQDTLTQLDRIADADPWAASRRPWHRRLAWAGGGALALFVGVTMSRAPGNEWQPPRLPAPLASLAGEVISGLDTETPRPTEPVPAASAAPSPADTLAESAAPDTSAGSEHELAPRAPPPGARRKAQLLAQQERAAAEEAQRLQQQAHSQREFELAQQQRQQQAADEARQRAEHTRAQELLAHATTRRGVRESCSADQACHVRECRRPEFYADAACAQLRDQEAARLRGSEH